MWLPYKILFVLLHILSLPLTIIFILFLILYKQCVRLLASQFQDFEGPLPSSNSIFLADKIWSKPSSTILICFEVEGPCSLASVAKVWQDLYDLRDANGARCYKELAYYPVLYHGYGFWRKAANFKLTDRFHLLSNKNKCKDYNELVTNITEQLHREPFQKDQPLWDIYFVPGVLGNTNKSLVFIRYHHLMADGMSFVKIFYASTGSMEVPPESYTRPCRSVENWNLMYSNPIAKICMILQLATVGFIDYLDDVLLEKDRNPLNFDPKGQSRLDTMGDWIHTVGRKLDVDTLKKASKQWDCSIVQFMLCAVSNGLEQYIRKYYADEKMPEGINFLASLPTPGHPDLKLCNHWCLGKIRAQFGIQSVGDKMEYFKEEAKRSAERSLPMISAFIFGYGAGILPVSLVSMLSKAKGTSTAILSNVVGPHDKERLYGGAKVTGLLSWQPIAQDAAPLAVGIVSCNGGLRVCLTAQSSVFPNRERVQELSKMVENEFVEFCRKVGLEC